MPFQMKVQPIDSEGHERSDFGRPVAKSRLKRLLERQFPSVLRISTAEKLAVVGDGKEKERGDGGGGGEVVEPSSVCLDKMVLSFIEEGHNEKPQAAWGRCNCFNGNNYEDSSDDDDDDDLDLPSVNDPVISPAPNGDPADVIKGLVLCANVAERNLLADASRIVAEKTKSSKGKDDCRKIVVTVLRSLGYDASICMSRWDKNPSFPAGEYEYIDVIVAGSGERLIVDVDFKSEFETARPTKAYRAVLQHLPAVFVGSPGRLQQIVAVAAEAARQSLKKKGLHVPPWRKPEYMQAKWVSPYQRTTAAAEAKDEWISGGAESGGGRGGAVPTCSIVPAAANFFGGFEVQLEESTPGGGRKEDAGIAATSPAVESKIAVLVSRPVPASRPNPGAKVVTGLASVL